MKRRLLIVTALAAIALLVLLAPIVTFFGLVAVREARVAARRRQVRDNLRKLALAMEQYHESSTSLEHAVEDQRSHEP